MAAMELFRVRRKFMDRVSSAALTQILDHLLENSVLRDEERQSILEMNSGTADRARRLVDVVRKKGEVASGIMIGHIQNIDGNMYAELFPQVPPGAPGAPADP